MAHRYGQPITAWSLVQLLYNRSYHELARLQSERRMGRDRMVRRFRLATGLLLGLLVVSGCATTLVRPLPTPSPTLTPSPPNPFPLTTPLASPPTDCPATPPLQHIDFAQFGSFSGPVRFFGGAPVWIPDEYFPHPIMHVEPPSAGLGPDPYPGFKILWEIGPNTLPPTTARVTNLRTGARGWWGNSNKLPPTKVVFDIEGGIDHGEVDTGWHEWGSLLFVPAAGCYALDVRWAGGSWRTIFAAGR